jgi:hypothetical protein
MDILLLVSQKLHQFRPSRTMNMFFAFFSTSNILLNIFEMANYLLDVPWRADAKKQGRTRRWRRQRRAHMCKVQHAKGLNFAPHRGRMQLMKGPQME